MSGTEVPRKSWLHPAMEVRASPIEGHGLIATAEIRAGDTVALLGGRMVSGHQLRQLLARADAQDPPTYVDAITVAADAHLVLPEGARPSTSSTTLAIRTFGTSMPSRSPHDVMWLSTRS